VKAVSDSGPLIHLSWIDHLFLLPRFFDEVSIPVAVRDEILAASPGSRGLDKIRRALAEPWLRVQPIANEVEAGLVASLDLGEAEALSHSLQSGADMFLTDDRAARTAARQRGLNVIGTIGLLGKARESGILREAGPLVLELRRLGQWIEPTLLQLVLDQDAQR